MPKETEDKMAVTVWLEKSLVERIDNLAEKGDLTRSKLIANMIEVTTGELELMKTVGIYAIAKIFRDMKEALERGRKTEKKSK
jgi:metal-responsive CopG/Arc/MetJ family transcriptional regulator